MRRRSISVDLGTARVRQDIKLIHLQLVREILSTLRPQSRTARIARFTRVAHVSFASHVSLVSHVFVSRELLCFICEQLLLRCQVALVLNEELVDTVRDMLVDLSRPILHVVERLLVRDIIDCDDVVCVPVVIFRGCPETLMFRSAMYPKILN